MSGVSAVATLPIARRSFGSRPIDAHSEGLGFCSSCDSASCFWSDASTTVSDCEDRHHVTIKNTFIEVAPQPGDAGLESLELGPRGAKSCTARLLRVQGQMPEAEQVPSPAAWANEDSSDSDGTLWDPYLSGSTPWGDSPMARASDLLRMPTVQTPRQGTTVMLQIPLKVGPGHPLASGAEGDVQVNVTHEDGSLVISLRVASSCASETTLGAPLRISPMSPSPDHAKTLAPSTAADGVLPAPPSPPSPPKRAGRKSVDARPAGEKSFMVCCHWKNKGWCKYRDTCKFQHPEHKKGAGLMAVAQAAATALAQQQREQLPSTAAPTGVDWEVRRVLPSDGTVPRYPSTPPPLFPPRLAPTFPARWNAAGGAVDMPGQTAGASYPR